MSIDWQAGWNQATGGIRYAANVAGDAAGHVFNCLAVAKDDVPTFNRVLHVATHTIAAVRHERALRGESLLISGLEKSLDKTIAVIDITRVFSAAYYFLSGNFFADLLDWNSSGPFKAVSEVSFAAADCIEAYVGVDEMLQMANGMEVHQNDTTEVLENLGNAFLIGGYAGQICKSTYDLAAGQIKNPVAWLDLAAAVAGIAIPILVLSNVIIVPLLIALGLASCALSIASTIYASYHPAPGLRPEGASTDFASNTLGLGTALGPIAPLATLLEDEPGCEPLVQIAADIRPFGEMTGALAIFTRLKEWFHPVGGRRFWEREETTGWKIGSRACATVQSGMDVASWLGGVGAINSAFRRNPIFKALRSAFAGAAAGLSAVDSSITLNNLQKDWQTRQFKAHKWQVLSATLNPNPGVPQVEGWVDLKADLIAQYHDKIQSDLAYNGLRLDSGNTYLRALKTAIENGATAEYFALKSPAHRLAQDEINVAALLRDNELHGRLESGTLTPDEAVLVREQVLADADRSRIERDILLPAKKQKLTVQALDLRECSTMQVVKYKKELCDWKFRELDVKKTNASWQLTSDLFKVATAIVSLVVIIFAPVLGVFPILLSLASAATNGGKYLADARYKKLPRPKAPVARLA